MIRRGGCASSNLYSVSALGCCTNIPFAADGAQDGGTILTDRHGVPCSYSVSRLGIQQRLQALTDLEVRFGCYLVCMIAPSITTPAETYFQSATMSMRTSATMVGFSRRPPFCNTRSLNQRVSAEPG